jgi:elongation factor Ts
MIMVEITANTVKELREKTGAGIMDCKAALSECNGDIEAAVDYLRKKGLAAASKKSGRVAAEGLIACSKTDKSGSLIELNSETDFVARNDKFQQLAKTLVGVAGEFNGDVEAMKVSKPNGFSKTVSEEIVEHIAVIGENINLRRVASISVEDGVVGSYVHNATAENLGKIGVLVALESSGDKEKLMNYGKFLAMHIAAAKPEALERSDLDPKSVEQERQIFIQQSIDSGNSPEIAQKMVEGRMRKFFEEVVLLEQTYMIDNKTKISDLINQISSDVGASVKITKYVRFALGEGIDTSSVE